jgi:hypothetical protein
MLRGISAAAGPIISGSGSGRSATEAQPSTTAVANTSVRRPMSTRASLIGWFRMSSIVATCSARWTK